MMQQTTPVMKLCIANSYYYNSGMAITNWIELPTDEDVIKKKLKEIQDNDDDGYIVLYGQSPFKCFYPKDLDIFELNRKLKKLSGYDEKIFKVISDTEELSDLSVMDFISQILSNNYEIYDNVTSEEELGRKLYEEGRLSFKIPRYLEKYIDFRKLGHDLCVKDSIRILPDKNLAEKFNKAS